METRGMRTGGDNQVVLPTLTHRDKRVLILLNFQLGVSVEHCHQCLEGAFPGQAPSVRTVREWYTRFRTGHMDLDDAPREGRPRSAIVDTNVLRVRKLLDEDRRITMGRLFESSTKNLA